MDIIVVMLQVCKREMMKMITEILLIIVIVMSFGLLVYSHIELMKAYREADKVIDDE